MKKIVLPDRGAEVLFDMYDRNVRYLESLFDVQISARGSNLLIEGETHDVEALTRLLSDFASLIARGEKFQNGDLQQAFKQIAENSSLTLHDFFPKRQIISSGGRQVSPKSPNQKRYIEAIEQRDIVFAIGPAGTGKNHLARAKASSLLVWQKRGRNRLAPPGRETRGTH